MEKNQKKWTQTFLFIRNFCVCRKFFRIVYLTVFCFSISLIQIIAAESGSGNDAFNTVEQQQSSVSGVVTEQSGLRLPGVTVLVMGTTNGTITNADGEYTLNNVPGNATIQFSFVGMSTQEIAVAGQRVINVTLIEETIGLEEVVAVGYGVQRKETLTGSISKVDGEEIVQNPSVNVATSLAGKLPGLVLNQRTGQPGAERLEILIRGQATFNENGPLIVIDGVPRDNTLQDLNPEDIESITVLKDASAAIYGARAANGVILVTTKQGSQSSTTFNLTYNYAINQPTQNPEMMDAVTFANAINEAAWYLAGRPPMSEFTPTYSDEAIQKYRDGSDPILYPNTNWSDASTRDWATQQNVNLQASGGSENVRYLFSFGMSDQGGNYINKPDSYKRYNARVNVSADLTDNITVGANISAIISNREQGIGTDFASILLSNPTLVAVYPNGLIAPGRFRQSSLLSNRRGFDHVKNSPIQSTFTATYKVPFVEGLTLDASYNYDLRNQFRKQFGTPAYYHEYNVQTGEYDMYYTLQPIELTDTYSSWTTSLFNIRAEYETTINEDHNIKAMVGTEQQKETYSYANAYRKNFVSPAIPEINVGSSAAEDKDNGGSSSENAYNNFFGRLNYNFKSKYLLEFVFRYDGSPKFPEGKRYGFFPAVSAGWRISEESFMANLSFLDELKLRGSYGELGNDRVSAYQYLQAFQFGNNYVFGGADAPGIYSSVMPNPDITWEVSKKLDVGLEAVLWNRLLTAELTVFHENRSNILLGRNLSVANVFGFPALPDENIGEVDNNGFELNLGHRNTVGDITYTVNGNIAYAKSKIVFMDEVPPAEDYQANTGMPLGSGLYYKSDGIFNTPEELAGYPYAEGTQVGDIKIIDLNKDGVINGDDRYRVNNSPTPELVFGLTAGLEYKGFDMTLFFQGQARAYTYDGTLTEFGEADLDNNVTYRAENRWTIDNQENATMPRADSWEPGDVDFFLYDATFIRLKNAEIGYNLGNELSKKVGLNDVRVFVSGTNLLTWAKEITWRDPEISGGFGQYPPLRIINFGINVKF